MMNQQIHLDLMRVREFLKRWNIIVYTGNALDDIVLMDLELADIYEGKHIEDREYLEMKRTLRRAYEELGGE
jgi:uncharacterized protein YqgQ